MTTDKLMTWAETRDALAASQQEVERLRKSVERNIEWKIAKTDETAELIAEIVALRAALAAARRGTE